MVHLQAAVFSIHTQSSLVECALLGEVCLKETAVHSTQAKLPGYNIQQPSKNHRRISLKMLKPQMSNLIPPMVKPSETRLVSQNVNEQPGQDGPGCLERPCSFAQRLRAWCSLDVKCIGGVDMLAASVAHLRGLKD